MFTIIRKYVLSALLIGATAGLGLTAFPQSARADRDDWREYWRDYHDWQRDHHRWHQRHHYRYYDDDRYYYQYYYPPYRRYYYRYPYRYYYPPDAGIRLGPFRFEYWH